MCEEVVASGAFLLLLLRCVPSSGSEFKQLLVQLLLIEIREFTIVSGTNFQAEVF